MQAVSKCSVDSARRRQIQANYILFEPQRCQSHQAEVNYCVPAARDRERIELRAH